MGKIYSYKCDKCGYALRYMQGVGFYFTLEAENMLTDMKQGKFGKRFMEASNMAVAPSVEFSRELFKCECCGELRQDLKLDLLDDNKVILSKRHVCGKCRSQMNIVKSTNTLKCPKCESELLIEEISMWD